MVRGKPVICVSAAIERMESDPRRLSSRAHHSYTDALRRAGGIPVVTGGCCAEELAELCDALVLSGGADLDPQLYGEPILNDSVKIQTERDVFEMELFRAFLDRSRPVFGICRGCQLINVALGGTLYQDLVEQKGLVHFDTQLRHEVCAEEGSVLHRLFGARFCVNSTHHQSVKTLAPGLRLTARSSEGIVEAFEHETLPILATQFHPERLTGQLWDERTPDFLPLFVHFVEMIRG